MKGHFARVSLAIGVGELTSKLVNGRNHDRRYWISAKAALGKIQRQLEVVTRERDALRAVVDQEEER